MDVLCHRSVWLKEFVSKRKEYRGDEGERHECADTNVRGTVPLMESYMYVWSVFSRCSLIICGRCSDPSLRVAEALRLEDTWGGGSLEPDMPPRSKTSKAKGKREAVAVPEERPRKHQRGLCTCALCGCSSKDWMGCVEPSRMKPCFVDLMGSVWLCA